MRNEKNEAKALAKHARLCESCVLAIASGISVSDCECYGPDRYETRELLASLFIGIAKALSLHGPELARGILTGKALALFAEHSAAYAAGRFGKYNVPMPGALQPSAAPAAKHIAEARAIAAALAYAFDFPMPEAAALYEKAEKLAAVRFETLRSSKK